MSAARTAGTTAIADAVAPASSVRKSLLDSTPLTKISGSSPFRSTNCTEVSSAQRASASPSVKSMSAQLAARPTARYSAPLSRKCQPNCSATAREIVPLPDPLGPSIVTTGTEFIDVSSLNRRQL